MNIKNGKSGMVKERYESPRLEVVEMGINGVICNSGWETREDGTHFFNSSLDRNWRTEGDDIDEDGFLNTGNGGFGFKR